MMRPSASANAPMAASPATGYTIHIDADKHFSGHSDEIIHHWCKPFSDGEIECQLYDGDASDARLVGVETIVTPATYKSFSADEQALWHYHRTEIPKLHATTPGLTKEQSDKLVASLMETYGKVWILWDPMTSKEPTGQPSITVLK
jgi:hypothetical protein